MSTTADDGAVRRPTLREEANAGRIGRSRFIGNLVGYLVLGGFVLAGAMLAKLTEPVPLPPGMTPPDPAPVMPNHFIILAVIGVLLLALLDLGIRRRHDRGARGIDVTLWVVLIGAVVSAHAFGWLPMDLLRYADIGVGAISLYFLLVLVFLPGKAVENRYGPPERRLPPV